MTAFLVEMKGERKGYMHAVEADAVVIGRSAEADIVVQSGLLSRKHVRVWREGDRYMAEDLSTRNGTLLNGEPLTAARVLSDGDEILVPGMMFSFRSTEETSAAVSVARSRTLTFLFTDLRGYVSHAETLGDAAAAVHFAEYRGLMRAEIAKAPGAQIKTEGHSFFVTFESAAQAVRCAIAILRGAQRLSTAHPERPIVIGAGLHAGEPVRRDDGDYVGSALNIAARLCSNAAPEELLVSEVVRGLLPTSGIASMHERTGIALKGVDDPPRIFAVDWKERPTAD